MHLKRLCQTVNKVMCHWINRTCRVLPHWYSLYGSIQGAQKNVLSALQSAGYKFCNLTSFIRLRHKIKNINISLKSMSTDNQIFGNCCVIIYCYLTKVSSQINKSIIFEPNELSITLLYGNGEWAGDYWRTGDGEQTGDDGAVITRCDT